MMRCYIGDLIKKGEQLYGTVFWEKNYNEIENAIIAADNGLISRDDYLQFVQSKGISSEKLYTIRRDLYKRKSEEGDPEAQNKYAQILELEGDMQEAEKYYTLSANQGQSEAMLSLYYGYSDYAGENGFGVNTQKQLFWIKKCAEAGNVKGMLALAREYNMGIITQKDEDEAEKWLWHAIDLGCPEGYIYLADLHKYMGMVEKRMCFLRTALSIYSIDEDIFTRAVTGLGYIYFPFEHNALANSKRATYFLSLAYMLGNNAVDDLRRKTGYQVTQEEYETWVEDARRMRVRM